MFGHMISCLRNMLGGFAARLLWALTFVVLITLLGIALIATLHFFMISGSAKLFCWSSFTIMTAIVISAVRLIVSWRTLQIHVTGEIFELFGALFHLSSGSGTTAAGTGILENPTSKLYLNMIRWILAIQLLTLVIFQNYLGGFTAFASSSVIMTIVVVTMIASALLGKWSLSGALLRWVVTATMVFYIVAGVTIAFPQVKELLGLNHLSFTPRSTARLINELRDVQSQQTEQANNRLMAEALEWQKINPGKKLPAEYETVILAAQKNMTVDEYHRWEKEQEDKKTAEAMRSAAKKNEKAAAPSSTSWKIVEVIDFTGNPYAKGVSFEPGEYAIDNGQYAIDLRNYQTGGTFVIDKKMTIFVRPVNWRTNPKITIKKK